MGGGALYAPPPVVFCPFALFNEKIVNGRFEYGEMNITKLNQRIDDIEDEIYR